MTFELKPDTAHETRVRRSLQKRVNNALYDLGRRYHESVPLDTVDHILTQAGFNALEPMLLCGREGQLHEDVGYNRWLTLTWYKMESGRYEVVAYVN